MRILLLEKETTIDIEVRRGQRSEVKGHDQPKPKCKVRERNIKRKKARKDHR